MAENKEAVRELTPEEALKKHAEAKARIAQVLSVGSLSMHIQRIMAALPSDRRGALIRDTDQDILRYETMGYRVEKGLKIEGLHDKGDGKLRVGDLILVTISVEDYAIIEEVRAEVTADKIDLPRKEFLQNPGTFDESVRHA